MRAPIVICNCGNEMYPTVYEPDQDAESYVGFDCPHCCSSLYGKYKEAENTLFLKEEE